jgi:hypothetical protein
LLCEDRFRQAIVGTLNLYDAQGEQLHTTYVAAAPQHGRNTFLAQMQREIEHIKHLYPNAHYQALANGTPEN